MQWESMNELIREIVSKPVPSLTIVLNLVIIESLLSIDNAAVLATMVLGLPAKDRAKALRYGILGAYLFRGVCLVLANLLIGLWWFKPLGGAYLFILSVRHFALQGKGKEKDAGAVAETKKQSALYQRTIGLLGPFWATVVLVELMDAAFSIDNVIAANAYTKNIILVCTGVFIGILAMRFVAQWFVRLMEKYTFLDACAYLVIGLLGLKLLLALPVHFMPCSGFARFLEGEESCLLSQGKELPQGSHPLIWGDFLTSLLSMAIFILPVLSSLLFKFPDSDAKGGEHR